MHRTHDTCIAAVGSMTASIKAERALLAAGITAYVVSLLPEETRRGCAYGVQYPCAFEAQVRAALRDAHLSVSQYLKRGGLAP